MSNHSSVSLNEIHRENNFVVLGFRLGWVVTLTSAPFVISPSLYRYPRRPRELLQASDAADALMIDHFQTLDWSAKRVLILLDQFGALSTALTQIQPTVYTDSYCSQRAILDNSGGKIQPLSNLNQLDGKYDLVLMRIPNNLSFFEDILAKLTAHLAWGAKIIAGVMVKHQAKTSFDLLNQYIGNTSTSLAQKKARLIFATFEKKEIASPYPLQVQVEGFSQAFTHHSNLFSREKLDIGTRFFLEHLPQGNFKTILDLGCANGIVGIKAKQLNPPAKLIFSDDSAMAIESAKINYLQFIGELGETEFKWINAYENEEKNSLDLVLCNPPFHQQHAVGDGVGEQMFRDSFSALRLGGSIRVIGNRHLAYGNTLKRIFGQSRVVAQNPKFTVYESVKV